MVGVSSDAACRLEGADNGNLDMLNVKMMQTRCVDEDWGNWTEGTTKDLVGLC